MNGSCCLAAAAAERAVLEYAQHRCLRCHGHLSNFVQLQSSPCLQLEAAGTALESSSECALLMAEDFAFKQSFLDSRAVDGKERFIPSRAKIVNCARDEFFAGSASASDEDGGSAGSYHLD